MELAVSGAAGFLGRALVQRALQAGHRVRALLLPGEAIPGDWEAGDVELVRGDLADSAGESRALLGGADVFLHLAAIGVQAQDRDWSRMVAANVQAPAHWAGEARRHGLGHLVAVGTCLEYSGFGTLPDQPWPADQPAPRCHEDSPVEASDPYGATKASGGVLLRACCRHLQLPLSYLRLASLYGPGDNPAKLIPGAIASARQGLGFAITPGEQVREWFHIDDAVTALLRVVESDPPASGQTLNVGTGVGIALRDLVLGIFKIAGQDPALVEVGGRPYRARDVHHLVMDCTRAEQSLGLKATVELDHGLDGLLAEG